MTDTPAFRSQLDRRDPEDSAHDRPRATVHLSAADRRKKKTRSPEAPCNCCSPATGGTFLATCALGFTNPAMPLNLCLPQPAGDVRVAGGYAYVIDTGQPGALHPHSAQARNRGVACLPTHSLLLFIVFHSMTAWGHRDRHGSRAAELGGSSHHLYRRKHPSRNRMEFPEPTKRCHSPRPASLVFIRAGAFLLHRERKEAKRSIALLQHRVCSNPRSALQASPCCRVFRNHQSIGRENLSPSGAAKKAKRRRILSLRLIGRDKKTSSIAE